MNMNNNTNLYKLDEFYRRHLKAIEQDRIEKKLSEEDYFKERMERFKIETTSLTKRTKCKDDGVDFTIKYNNEILICQLKYWAKPLNNKLVKRIFGEMYLSRISMNLRNLENDIKYLLICPFIGEGCIPLIEKYSKQNYYIVSENSFVEMLLNPINFFDKKIYMIGGKNNEKNRY